MQTPLLTRRHALMTAATLPLAAMLPQGASASAGLLGSASPGFNRFRLGAFEVTTILAGSVIADKPQESFGLNVTPEDFAAAATANFIPADKVQFVFSPTVVNTGKALVLFDTGLNPEAITGGLVAAGYTPDQVDVVVLTHMHPDHIGGMAGDGGPTFAKARIVTGAVEHNYWMGAANAGFDKLVRPLNDRITFLDDGGSVGSGITAMAAFGHSPGHMGYVIESDGHRVVITADTANHFVWSLGHPDWEVKYDQDKAAAAAARRKVFGMLAADRVPFIGYHMPFPSLGFVEAQGDGFRYVPATYQMALNG